MTSVASYRIDRTAFAPSCWACSSMRSNASSRVFSHNSVSNVMLPPTSVCSEAPMVPSTDRDRTVMPRTTPSDLVVRYPSIVSVVVVIPCSIATCPPIARSAQDLTGQRVRHFSARDHRHAVHEHVFHPRRKLMRVLERREILDLFRIEDDDVRPEAGLEHAAVGEAHARGGQRRELANRVLERERVLLADVLPQDAGERPVRPGVWMLESEQPVRRRPLRIVVDRHPRL